MVGYSPSEVTRAKLADATRAHKARKRAEDQRENATPAMAGNRKPRKGSQGPEVPDRLIAYVGLAPCGAPQCRDMECVIPFGTCHDGCGIPTTVAKQNHAARGWVKGRPLLYAAGHRKRAVKSVQERREEKASARAARLKRERETRGIDRLVARTLRVVREKEVTPEHALGKVIELLGASDGKQLVWDLGGRHDSDRDWETCGRSTAHRLDEADAA
jgi:hypothetical protein